MALSISSAVVDGTGMFVTVAIGGATLPLTPPHDVSGFALKDGGKTILLDYADSIGANVYLVPSSPIQTGDVITFDVDGSNLADSTAGTPLVLANSTANAVTNSSTLASNQDVVGMAGSTSARGEFSQKTGDEVSPRI
jgi:hypothetical protein